VAAGPPAATRGRRDRRLSAFYLDVQKDVLYCEAADSPRRRSAQTAMAEVADVLVRLVAPVLVHTAEEAWSHLPAPAEGEREASVHLAAWPEVDADVLDEDLLAEWEWLQDVRRDVYAVLETFRRDGRFDKHAEARVALAVADASQLQRLREVGADRLADLLLVSEVALVSPEEAETLDGETALGETAGVKRLHSATLLVQEYARCERCWNYRAGVGETEPDDLCARCRQVVADGA